jgi:hypothetical protein
MVQLGQRCTGQIELRLRAKTIVTQPFGYFVGPDSFLAPIASAIPWRRGRSSQFFSASSASLRNSNGPSMGTISLG